MIMVSDILDDLGLTYRTIGNNYLVNCWHHPENKPSMSIKKDTGVFHCFSCGSSGNLYTILKDHLNITGIDALQYLAQYSDVRMNDAEGRIRQFKEDVLNPRNKDKVLKRRIVEMPRYKPIRLHSYLIKRGFVASEISQWKMGEVDFVQTNEQFLGYGGWIIIPIYQNGKLRNYFLRSPFSNKKLYGKYSVKDVIFGYDTAKDFSKPVYIVEGIFDMIKLRRTGVQVVASLTNKIYEEKFKLLKQYSKIIIVPDNDEPGFRLAFDALTFLNNNIPVSVCKIPGNKKDTGDCTQEELEQTISHEYDIVEYIMEMQYAAKFGKSGRV